jgi:hypothetical protein
MTKRLSIIALMALAIIASPAAFAAEPVPGDSCTASEEDNFQRTGGKEIPTGHLIVCKSGTWRSILSWDAAAAITKIGNLSCTNNQILKFNGTTWGCAADNGGTLPGLNSAQIWIGNASNAATAVTMSGDATLSNAGVLTIGSNAIGTAEITNASIALADLSATGTANATTYLRGDNTWATVPSGADNLGNHTATQTLNMGGFNVTGASRFLASGSSPNPTSGIDTFGVMTSGTYGGGIGLQDGTGDFGLWLDGTGANARFGFGTSLGALTTAMSLTNAGTVSATLFAGSGANLTNLNASSLASGTVPTARLGSGTANSSVFLRGDGTWAAAGADNLGNHTATTTLAMGGNPISGVTNVNSNGDYIALFSNRANDTSYEWLGFYSGATRQGIIIYDGAWDSCAADNTVCFRAESGNNLHLKADGDIYMTPSGSDVVVAGTVAATSFSGAGANLNSLNATNLTSGTVATARLGSGTANSTTFLRGDNTWAAAPAGGVSGQTTVSCTAVNNGATCTTANCPAGYFLSGCSAWSSVFTQQLSTIPNGSACQCRQGSGGGGTLTCTSICLQ